MINDDTIAAICTGPGGALAILRISGKDALTVAGRVWTSAHPLSPDFPRRLSFGFARTPGGGRGEPCMAVFMPGPASYTGEDVVEIQCHGGTFAPKRMLASVIAAGARSAEPGEFTKRAFLNGKMDLTEAEAVADLISARSESACRIAERQLTGAVGRRISAVSTSLRSLLAELESRLDFPEEELDWQPPESLCATIREAETSLRSLLSTERAGIVARDGVNLVIAGKPNAGKSSLLNLLLGYDRAIVTDLPGTTRDTLCETAALRGIPVNLTDTAGLRDQTGDRIEKLGIERSIHSLREAQVVFWVFDMTDFEPADLERMKQSAGPGVIAVWNKSDAAPGFSVPDCGVPSAVISASSGSGLESLLDCFEREVWGSGGAAEPDCAVSVRHASAIRSALDALKDAETEILRESMELAAADLRLAVESVASVTGESARPDVLDEIFSKFCIGK